MADMDQHMKATNAASPQQAALHIPKSLIGAPDLAGYDGACATWSRVQHGGNVYAVGCAHCAFYYKSIGSDEVAFVSLPEDIVERAVTVHFFESLLSNDQVASPTTTDFVAVQLNETLDAKLPVWSDRPPDISEATGVVAGRAHTCSVVGEATASTASALWNTRAKLETAARSCMPSRRT